MVSRGDRRLGEVGRAGPRFRLRWRSRLLLAGAAATAFWLLIGYSLPHNGLLLAALFMILALMGLIVGLVLGLVWLGRRAWRRGTWLSDLAALAGLPWLGRALWAAGQVRTAARSGTTR
jgi:hypothetical protein